MAPDSIFTLLALATIISAALAVELKNIIHAVVSFCGMCVVIGILYAYWGVVAVAFFQIIVYGSAVVVLLLMTIMLTHGG